MNISLRRPLLSKVLQVPEGILTAEVTLYLPTQIVLVFLSIPGSLLQVSDLPLLLGDLNHVS